ncbi:unnamed protein product [Brassica oleracea]|uniref:Uncharacterized protein n=1 Tax=Brassica oleracea TaxID=3712 RepID=A0A3P6DIH8_BRAOL|nr:unnamed protein product [Brassica oleracea]
MLAFSGCSHGCNPKEEEELTRMRYADPWWKEKALTDAFPNVIEGLLSELETTPALQPTSQPENINASPNFVPTFSTLVDFQSTPIAAPIIESSPSIVINTEVCETLVVDPLTTSSITLGFESPSQFKGLGDVDEVVTKASSSINLTRGGRETKLPIKYQEME